MKIFLIALLCFVLYINSTSATVTEAEFNLAVTKAGYPKPNVQIYKAFSDGTRGYSREEQAMLLAQLLHESIGFKFLEELACKKDKCKNSYIDKVGLPGKHYYGRGYIQLTWGANYKAASKALGMGDKLLKNPELVSSDKKIAMLVSIWYWEHRVRPLLKGHDNWFGRTTKGINGGECTKPKLRARAVHRWDLYKKVADAWKIKNKALEKGCYN